MSRRAEHYLMVFVLVMAVLLFWLSVANKPKNDAVGNIQDIEFTKPKIPEKSGDRRLHSVSKTVNQSREKEVVRKEKMPETEVDLRQPHMTPTELREWRDKHRRNKRHETHAALQELQKEGLLPVDFPMN